jgi:SAM-dependent methyltransferase
MSDQADLWSRAAEGYEEAFIDPYLPGLHNPLPRALARLAGKGRRVAADLGCGIGPLLPCLAKHFKRVIAIDFAPGMLDRARQRCAHLKNVEYLQMPLTDLGQLAGQLDVAVAVNSLVMPDLGDLEAALAAIHRALRPGGRFLGIVPGMDAVHYLTMLLVDRARQSGMPQDKARQNAAQHGEHELYDFTFGQFRFQGIEQHFWQPFEIGYRLRRAGFKRIRRKRVALSWQQLPCGRELAAHPAPWDWFFHARRPRS